MFEIETRQGSRGRFRAYVVDTERLARGGLQYVAVVQTSKSYQTEEEARTELIETIRKVKLPTTEGQVTQVQTENAATPEVEIKFDEPLSEIDPIPGILIEDYRESPSEFQAMQDEDESRWGLMVQWVKKLGGLR